MARQYLIGNYEETYRTFKLPTPERYNWAYEVFDEWAKDSAKRAMLWISAQGKERDVSYREFAVRSKRAANALSNIGAKPGDRVMTMLPRVVEWWEIVLGCIRGQFVAVPGTTLMTPRDIIYRIHAAGITVAITDAENAHKFEAAKEQCPDLREVVVVGGDAGKHFDYERLLDAASPNLSNPNNLSSDLMMIYFTSGTTGHAKMVPITHSNYPIGHISTGKFWMDQRPTDLHWTLSDTGWAQAAWSCFFGPWNMGSALFVWDQRGKYDPASTLLALEKYPITTFFAPPTVYRMLVLEDLRGFQPKSLRHCMGAGEPVNPEVIDAWRDGAGYHIWEAYGQTETTLCIATFPGMEHRPGSMGVAAPGYEMAIVDDQGNELPDGEEGEIAIRTNPHRPVGLFPGYWRNPEANENCFRGDWYYTGDRAARDQDGYYWFIGRSDDVIISASYRIGPFEVESALLEHDAVAEAAVVAKPDPARTNIVKAFVVLAPKYEPSPELSIQLQEHVKTSTAPYKYPREIEFVDELPKTISGKIRRTELRQYDSADK